MAGTLQVAPKNTSRERTGDSRFLNNAICSYGPSAFEITILRTVPSDQREVAILAAIAEYGTYANPEHYNLIGRPTVPHSLCAHSGAVRHQQLSRPLTLTNPVANPARNLQGTPAPAPAVLCQLLRGTHGATLLCAGAVAAPLERL